MPAALAQRTCCRITLRVVARVAPEQRDVVLAAAPRRGREPDVVVGEQRRRTCSRVLGRAGCAAWSESEARYHECAEKRAAASCLLHLPRRGPAPPDDAGAGASRQVRAADEHEAERDDEQASADDQEIEPRHDRYDDHLRARQQERLGQSVEAARERDSIVPSRQRRRQRPPVDDLQVAHAAVRQPELTRVPTDDPKSASSPRIVSV